MRLRNFHLLHSLPASTLLGTFHTLVCWEELAYKSHIFSHFLFTIGTANDSKLLSYLFKHFNWFCISRNTVHSLSKFIV